MKRQIRNIQEISPIILLSVLLFVSCTQLPIEDQTVNEERAQNIEENDGDIATVDLNTSGTVTQAEQGELSETAEELVEEVAENLNEQPLISSSEIVNTEVLTEEADGEIQEITEQEITEQELLEQSEPNENLLPSVEELARINDELRIHQRNIEALCEEIGDKLGSVSVEDCLIHELEFAGAYSVNARPLAMRDFHPRSESDLNTKVLIMGGIHGDEYSSISIMFKWMSLIQESSSNSYTWRFLPTVNPDGLLDGQAVRQNASGVDLNRNNDPYWATSNSSSPDVTSIVHHGAFSQSEPETTARLNAANLVSADQFRSYTDVHSFSSVLFSVKTFNLARNDLQTNLMRVFTNHHQSFPAGKTYFDVPNQAGMGIGSTDEYFAYT
mgnify:CR=1 FL=1